MVAKLCWALLNWRQNLFHTSTNIKNAVSQLCYEAFWVGTQKSPVNTVFGDGRLCCRPADYFARSGRRFSLKLTLTLYNHADTWLYTVTAHSIKSQPPLPHVCEMNYNTDSTLQSSLTLFLTKTQISNESNIRQLHFLNQIIHSSFNPKADLCSFAHHSLAVC